MSQTAPTPPAPFDTQLDLLLAAVASIDAAQRRLILTAAADLIEATLPAPDPLATRGTDPANAARSQPVRGIVNRLRAAAR